MSKIIIHNKENTSILQGMEMVIYAIDKSRTKRYRPRSRYLLSDGTEIVCDTVKDRKTFFISDNYEARASVIYNQSDISDQDALQLVEDALSQNKFKSGCNDIAIIDGHTIYYNKRTASDVYRVYSGQKGKRIRLFVSDRRAYE